MMIFFCEEKRKDDDKREDRENKPIIYLLIELTKYFRSEVYKSRLYKPIPFFDNT
jgi:hypothetical protein